MLHLTDFQWLGTAIGWTILHSIWQIALIGFIWVLVISKIKSSKTSSRYLLSMLALMSIGIVSTLTLFSELKMRYPATIVSSESLGVVTNEEVGEALFLNQAGNPKIVPVETPSTQPLLSEAWISKWISPAIIKLIALIWVFGVLFFALRFVLQWAAMQRLGRVGTHPFDAEQLAVFNQLKNKSGINRSITFLQSGLIASPLTFGHFKPVILLPLGMINGFPPAQIEAILLHELAHIRRNDFLINIIQTWTEILFFYHPVVWFISKKIRSLREELCDDQVVKINRNKTVYAESLLQLQKYFLHQKNQLAMNAKGNKNELSNRINRLFSADKVNTKKSKSLNVYLLGLVMLMVFVAYAFSTVATPTVSVSADKMNVLYIGVDNPLTIAAAGLSAEKTKVESDDLVLVNQGEGHYTAKASQPGTAIIKVTPDGHPTQDIVFRVKRIPDPIARMGDSHGGNIDVAELKRMKGIHGYLGNFAYDASCTVDGYNFTFVAKNEDPVEVINRSAAFNDKTLKILERAKSGDIIYIDHVMCQCPGDEEPRPVNSLVFKVR